MKTEKRTKPAGKKRALLVLAALFLSSVLVPLAASGYVVASTQARIISFDEAAGLQADAILVLGARVREGGVPSSVLEDRLIAGLSAYESGASGRLLMSGDHGQEDYDEVNAMKDYAISAGIPSEAVFMDHAGFSTYESLYRARDIFQVRTVLIVTQEYHLYRALYVARALGLDAYGVAADRRAYSGMPRFEAREILARTKDLLYSILQPLPTYLGDVIPITGDGNATNG